MTDYKLVPVEPTAEMVEAAESAYMPFGDMELAIRMAVLAAPDVQGEPVAWMTTARVFGEGFTTDRRQGEKWMKSHPSKTTPLYTAPQPAPDVAALVEALNLMVTTHDEGGWPTATITIARAALAAHRKGAQP